METSRQFSPGKLDPQNQVALNLESIISHTEDYKSDKVDLQFLSSLAPEEAEFLIGKKIERVIGGEYSLTLVFEGGGRLKISGHTYKECALAVELSEE